MERLGWEWCPRGHCKIGIVAEKIDLAIQQDLEAIQRMDGNAGEARSADPTGLSRMVSEFRDLHSIQRWI